jgi:hypothetical protein
MTDKITDKMIRELDGKLTDAMVRDIRASFAKDLLLHLIHEKRKKKYITILIGSVLLFANLFIMTKYTNDQRKLESQINISESVCENGKAGFIATAFNLEVDNLIVYNSCETDGTLNYEKNMKIQKL